MYLLASFPTDSITTSRRGNNPDTNTHIFDRLIDAVMLWRSQWSAPLYLWYIYVQRDNTVFRT